MQYIVYQKYSHRPLFLEIIHFICILPKICLIILKTLCRMSSVKLRIMCFDFPKLYSSKCFFLIHPGVCFCCTGSLLAVQQKTNTWMNKKNTWMKKVSGTRNTLFPQVVSSMSDR